MEEKKPTLEQILHAMVYGRRASMRPGQGQGCEDIEDAEPREEVKMTGRQEPARVLKTILGLAYEPIAVKFFEQRVSLPGFEIPTERRYCLVLLGAIALISRGES